MFKGNKCKLGFKEHVNKEEVYVRCMHSFGRKLEKSQFYCSNCMIDMCWCSIDNVVCKIDDPKKVGIWYRVDESVWMPIFIKELRY